MPRTPASEQHPNDMYGDLAPGTDSSPAIPAATVVLLRNSEPGHEVLMLRKNSKLAFGGMWVFPGGRIDPNDHDLEGDLQAAARNAAAREAREEAGISIDPSEFVWFSHWTPPETSPKRFATWFFASRTDATEPIQIDGGEIHDHRWIQPGDALERHSRGEIDLVPPTWVTLYQLSLYPQVSKLLEHLKAREPKVYATRIGIRGDGVRVALWQGDSGYRDSDANRDGPHHRLVMAKEGFEFEHSAVEY